MVDTEELLYVFVSFDLVNSTEYKCNNPEWARVFYNFYLLTAEKFTGCFSRSEPIVWKRLGDEILFYIILRDKTEMYKLLEYVDETLTRIQEFLSQYKSIYVKSSVWTAGIATYTEDAENYSNVALSPKVYKEYDSLDFIGSDIDTGFRISKYVTKGRIVVSAELAYILNKMECPDGCEDISKYLRIVDYEKLKGVWDNKPYPIVWYYSDWNNIKFDYDEHVDSKIASNIKKKIYDPISELNNILKQVEKLDKCNQLHELFVKTISNEILSIENECSENLEFHVVAIVLDTNEHKVFMEKRTSRKYLNNIWEFGCSQLTSNKTFEETVKKEYKEEFNLTIGFIEDKNTVATFLLDKNEKGLKQGIIFYAEGNSSNEVKLLKDKHSEYKWFSINEIEEKDDAEMVSDAKENIKKAFSFLDKRLQMSQ